VEIGDTNPLLHPNIDEARNLLIQDMMYTGGLGKLAIITGVEEVEPVGPRANLGDASYYTDGLGVAMFFVTRPRAPQG